MENFGSLKIEKINFNKDDLALFLNINNASWLAEKIKIIKNEKKEKICLKVKSVYSLKGKRRLTLNVLAK